MWRVESGEWRVVDIRESREWGESGRWRMESGEGKGEYGKCRRNKSNADAEDEEG